jgi:hypothetical protein
VALAVVVAAAAVAVVVVVTRPAAEHPVSSQRGPSAAGPASRSAPATTLPSPTARAAARWVSANLPVAAPILAAADAAGLIRALGARTVTDSSAACRPDAYVVATPALRSQARGDRAVAACLASSVPIATFVAGADLSEVRQVTPDPAQTQQARQRSLADRRRGGAALAANPAIDATAPVRRALVDGRLDLRAETVLAALAQRERFRIVAVIAEPAEVRAAMPARTVQLALTSRPAFDAVLAGLSGDYRPLIIRPPSGDTVAATWSFRAAPLPVLN